MFVQCILVSVSGWDRQLISRFRRRQEFFHLRLPHDELLETAVLVLEPPVDLVAQSAWLAGFGIVDAVAEELENLVSGRQDCATRLGVRQVAAETPAGG